jgi:nucleotide-binding universal stress UspA family protein
MTIIHATDFSRSSVSAGRVAAGLAGQLGDALVVTHVIEWPAVVPAEMAAARTVLIQGMEEHATGPLRVVAESLRARGVTVTERLLQGHPDEAIGRLARDSGARLVVVGTHGRTALGRLFMGTVAERLIARCPCPVLVVPEGAEGLAVRHDERPLKVVVGLERGPAGEAAVAFARSLRASIPCDVTFIHLYDPDREHARLGLAPVRHPSDADPDVVALLARELRPLVADLGGDGEVSLRIRPSWRRDPDPLVWEATVAEADLVLVGTQPREGGPWGRPAVIDTIRGATIPVLVAPAAPLQRRADPRALPPLRSVLAATDLSDGSQAAVLEAYRLLRTSGGVVELCHFVGEPLVPERWAAVQKQLLALVPPEADAWGVVTRTSVLQGPSVQESIVAAAERLGCDQIVLGSRSRSGLVRTVLGSVVDGVLKRASRPVLVVCPRG